MSQAQEIKEILERNPKIEEMMNKKISDLCLSDIFMLFYELHKEKEEDGEEVDPIDLDEFINKKYEFVVTPSIKTKISSAVFKWCIIGENGKMWLKPNRISEQQVSALYKIGDKTITTLKMMLKCWGYEMLP